MPLEALAQQFGTPLYVYDGDKIRSQYRLLKSAFSYTPTRFFYALKANSNPAILKLLLQEGAGADTVSLNEVRLAFQVGFRPENTIFTPANASDEDMAFAVEQGVILNLGALSELRRFGEAFPGGRVSVRINPNVGGGHHEHTITGGPLSKFGIDHTQTEEIKAIVKQYDLRLIGTHSHIGSGILEVETFLKAMDIVLASVQDFDTLEFIDFGGGFGIPYKPDEEPLDLKTLGEKASEKFAEFCLKKGYDQLAMYFEPGRFLVAEAGVLLARVNTVKKTPHRTFVCLNSGYANLMRPLTYGSYHEIVNLSHPDGEKTIVDIAGNICESGDMFGRERPLAQAQEGDILAIMNAGAYGMSMASNYNLQALPAEVLVEKGTARLVRPRQTFEDLVRILGL